MLPQLVQYPLNGLDVLFALVLNVDEDVIKVYYQEDVELLCQDLVDVTLTCDRCVGQSERHDLVLKMTIAGPEGRLPFVFFSNPHSMIGIGQIELGETSRKTSPFHPYLTLKRWRLPSCRSPK